MVTNRQSHIVSLNIFLHVCDFSHGDRQ